MSPVSDLFITLHGPLSARACRHIGGIGPLAKSIDVAGSLFANNIPKTSVYDDADLEQGIG
jgi:hypothetical protein